MGSSGHRAEVEAVGAPSDVWSLNDYLPCSLGEPGLSQPGLGLSRASASPRLALDWLWTRAVRGGWPWAGIDSQSTFHVGRSITCREWRYTRRRCRSMPVNSPSYSDTHQRCRSRSAKGRAEGWVSGSEAATPLIKPRAAEKLQARPPGVFSKAVGRSEIATGESLGAPRSVRATRLLECPKLAQTLASGV